MTSTNKQFSERVDVVMRALHLPPGADSALRVLFAEQQLVNSALLRIMDHLSASGTGDWSAQWEYVRSELQRVGYPPRD